MKTLTRITLCLAISAAAAFGQLNLLTQTTTNVAALASDKTIYLTSVTGINAPSQSSTPASELYVITPGNPRGEVMQVKAVNGTTSVTVTRTGGGAATAIPSGATVLIGPPNWFRDYDPSGGCTTASTYVAPHVNTKTGNQWLCSTITLSWVPGWQNTAPTQVTAAVASVAGATAINGPLQHVTGTNAITSFTMGVGWAFDSFCVIPDGAFTTTATNNILKASTAVVGRALCYTWDATNSGFAPSY